MPELPYIRLRNHAVPEFEREDNLRDSGIVRHLTREASRSICLGMPGGTKFLRDVHRWLLDEQARPVLMLSGTVGRGKTVAAGWALAHRKGKYITANEFLRLAAANFGEQHEQFLKLLDVSMLVVDDVGREHSDQTERMATAITELVDARLSRETIIITNESKPGFVERYTDERLLSRLQQVALWRGDKGQDLRAGKQLPEPVALYTPLRDGYLEEQAAKPPPPSPEEVAAMFRRASERLGRGIA